VADLRQRFPDALVTCDVAGTFSGPELICWNAHPRETWVWVLEPDDPAGARRASARLEQLRTAPDELTSVVDKPTDGIQLFRAFGIDGEDDFAERVAINLVLGAAYKADRASRRALGFRLSANP
jgi:hypothetical protein